MSTKSSIYLANKIANYCNLPSFSFGHALGKLQGKVLTHSEKVGWWRTLMVECVSIFFYYVALNSKNLPKVGRKPRE